MAQSSPPGSHVSLPPLLCSGKVLQPWSSSRRESAGPSAKPRTPGLASLPASREAHRQTFRQSTIPSGETPQETLTRLSDAAHRWLCPQESSKEQIVDRIVLEQFLALLPADMQGWFRAQGLGSSQEVAQLIESLLGEREPAHVAKASNSEWPLTEAKQKALYWEATKGNYENGASVVLQVSKEAVPQARASVGKEPESRKQLESTHPDSSSTSNDPDFPDIIVVEIKEERDLWQEDSKEDGNEIVSDHRTPNKEGEKENMYQPQGRPWPQSLACVGKETLTPFGSSLAGNHRPRAFCKSKQEVALTSTRHSPENACQSVSRFVTCQKWKTRGKLLYKRPDNEMELHRGSGSMGHPEKCVELPPYSCTNSETISSNSFAFPGYVSSTPEGRVRHVGTVRKPLRKNQP